MLALKRPPKFGWGIQNSSSSVGDGSLTPNSTGCRAKGRQQKSPTGLWY